MPTQTSTTTIDYHYGYKNWQNHVLVESYENLGTSFLATNQVIKDGPLPGYRQRISNGFNATTGLSGWKYDVVNSPANFWHESIAVGVGANFQQVKIEFKGHGLRSINSPQDLSVDQLATTHADNLAATRFASEVAAVASRFKGLTFSGELPEALRAIRSPFRSLRNGVSQYLGHLRRVGPTVPRFRRPKFVRDTWLEYAFGWRPLIADIDTAISQFYKNRTAHPIFEMVKASGTDRQNSVPVENSPADVGYGRYVYSTYHQETEVMVKYFGIYKSRGNGIADCHTYGFAPWEFVPTIWELIPYSFLVDYFTNIGNIISSWSYRFCDIEWVAKTVRKSHVIANIGTAIKLDPSSVYADKNFYSSVTVGSPGSSVARLITVDRTPVVQFAIPSLELQIPGLGVKWVNIFALSKNLNAARNALRS